MVAMEAAAILTTLLHISIVTSNRCGFDFNFINVAAPFLRFRDSFLTLILWREKRAISDPEKIADNAIKTMSITYSSIISHPIIIGAISFIICVQYWLLISFSVWKRTSYKIYVKKYILYDSNIYNSALPIDVIRDFENLGYPLNSIGETYMTNKKNIAKSARDVLYDKIGKFFKEHPEAIDMPIDESDKLFEQWLSNGSNLKA
jgi:hypothetical protein